MQFPSKMTYQPLYAPIRGFLIGIAIATMATNASATVVTKNVNLTVGTASQSTTDGAGPANRGINGNTGDFTHTSTNDPNPRWQVVMPSDFLINEITLYNRGGGCCPERLSDITVRVLNGLGAEVFKSGVLNPGNALSGPATIPVSLGGPVLGRTIEVTRDGASTIGLKGVLSLGEVTARNTAAYFPFGTNLTQAGIASLSVIQSTTLSGYPPERAIDNNSTNFTHTVASAQPGGVDPSWTVDFGANAAFEQVVIHNRLNCCKERLSDIKLEVLNASNVVIDTTAVLNPGNALGGPNSITVDITAINTANPGQPLLGRKIRISRDKNSVIGGQYVLSMSEVVVTGGSEQTDSEPDGMPDCYELANGLSVGTDDSASDLDTDGLTNIAEYDGTGVVGFNGGTFPFAADSDSDGRSDGDEINAVGGDATDPLDSDSDNDTLLDGEEVVIGNDGFITNPNLADSDVDGVNDNVDVDPNDSSSDSDADGLTDLEETSGSKNILFSNEPTNPLDIDSDDDTLTDSSEIDAHGSNPNAVDTDGDGADDPIEVQYGTDPNNASEEPFVATSSVLGIGTASLLGGDLTDPENNGTRANVPASPSDWATVLNWNWANISASNRPYFHSFGGTQGAFSVFDNIANNTDANSKWCCDPAPLNLTVEFPAAVALTHYTLTSSGDSPNRDPRVFQIQGSNDGTTWTTINSRNQAAINPFTARNQVVRFDLPAPSAPFIYIRYQVDATGGNQHAMAEIEYFGPADTTTDTDGGGIPDYYEDQFAFLDSSVTADDDLDHDGDGLSNEDEFLNNTNPDGPDSDNDGLNDNDEIINGTNPLVQDTDGDGRTDNEEINAIGGPASNPLDTDSDDDTLNDLEEVTTGADGFITNPNLADTDSDGVDDNLDSDPNNDNDQDSDGLLNSEETGTYGTNPFVADSDGDGLNDGDEINGIAPNFHTSDPNLVDTDSDGFNDNLEVAEGTDPDDNGSLPNLTLVAVIGGLLGNDITDPENDGVPSADPANSGFNYREIIGSVKNSFTGEGSWNVFDNTLGKWCCDAPPQTLVVRMAGLYSITHFTVTSSNDSPQRDPKNWAIQGSNDGSSWTNIYPAPGTNDVTSNIWSARNQTIRFDLPAASASYKWFRYSVTSTSSSEHALAEIELFGTRTDTYGTWAATNGLTGADAEPHADIENGGAGDNLNNLLEFAFGTNPGVSDNNVLTFTNATTFTVGTPVVETIFDGENPVKFRYVRRTDHASVGITYEPQFFDSAGEYVTYVNPPITVITDAGVGGDYELVQIPFPLFDATGQKASALFGRVLVTLP